MYNIFISKTRKLWKIELFSRIKCCCVWYFRKEKYFAGWTDKLFPRIIKNNRVNAKYITLKTRKSIKYKENIRKRVFLLIYPVIKNFLYLHDYLFT